MLCCCACVAYVGGVVFGEITCGLMPLCLSHGSDPLCRHGIPHGDQYKILRVTRHWWSVQFIVLKNMVAYIGCYTYGNVNKRMRNWLDLVDEIMQVGPQLSGDQSPTYSDGR